MVKRRVVPLLGIGLLCAQACITYEAEGPKLDDEFGFDSAGSGGSSGSASGGTGGIVTGTGTKEPGEPCAETQECVPGSICFNEFCVGAGMLRISLGFEVDSDYDLHVETPLGSEIYYANRSADGGTLDVDQCVSSCGTSSHVENVVFEDDAPAGSYRVWVRNFNGRGGGDFTIEVAGAVNQTFNGSLPATAGADSENFEFAVAGGSTPGGGTSGTGGSSGSGSQTEVDCEASCPSEFADAQLDAFCRMACCYTISGDPAAAASTCEAGASLGTGSCDYCN